MPAIVEKLLSFRIVQIAAALSGAVAIYVTVVTGFYAAYKFVTWAGN